MSERIPVVYGYFDGFDGLSVLLEQVAVGRAEEVQAVANARTVGDVKKVPFEHTPNLIQFLLESEIWEELPADDEPFSAEEVVFDNEFEWPPIIPAELIEKDTLGQETVRALDELGTRQSLMFRDFYLRIPLEKEQELVEVLERHGFTARRDDRLIVPSQAIDREYVPYALSAIEAGTYSGSGRE